MNPLPLILAPRDIPQRIVDFSAGQEAKRKFLAMGLHVGDTILKLNEPHWSPVLIRNLTSNSTKIAIGQGLARKMLVADARS